MAVKRIETKRNRIGTKLKPEEKAESLDFTDDSITEIFLAVREKRIGLSEFKEHLTEYLRARILGKNQV